MQNLDVRLTVAEYKVTYRAIAKKLGITPEYLSHLMGDELTTRNRDRIYQAIEQIVDERERGKHDV